MKTMKLSEPTTEFTRLRSQIRKFPTLATAYQALNSFSTTMFVFLGDCEDTNPYWVVDASAAEKLEAMGYERAGR